MESSFTTSRFDMDCENFKLDLPVHISDHLPLEIITLENIDEEFYAAIRHFKKLDVIGLSLEGVKIGRYGTLEWVTVSSSSATFMFDIQKLGDAAFKKGLKFILESSTVLKVIHDCRTTADCLFHQFEVKLAHIYDTQVSEFLVNVQKSCAKNVTNKVKSLNYCLMTYLQIPEKYLYQHIKIVDSSYSLRPLNYTLKNILIKNVIYLRRLKQEFDIIHYVPFRRCVDIHLQSVVKKTDHDLKLHPPNLERMPEELLVEKMKVFQFKKDLIKVASCVLPDKIDEEPIKYHKKEDIERRSSQGHRNESIEIATAKFQPSLDLNMKNLIEIDSCFSRNEVLQYLMDKMFVSDANNAPNTEQSNTSELGNSSLLSTTINFGSSSSSTFDAVDVNTVKSSVSCNLFLQNRKLQTDSCDSSEDFSHSNNFSSLKYNKRNMVEGNISNTLHDCEKTSDNKSILHCNKMSHDKILKDERTVSSSKTSELINFYNKMLIKRRILITKAVMNQDARGSVSISNSEFDDISCNKKLNTSIAEEKISNEDSLNCTHSNKTNFLLLDKVKSFSEQKGSSLKFSGSLKNGLSNSAITVTSNEQQLPFKEKNFCDKGKPSVNIKKSKIFSPLKDLKTSVGDKSVKLVKEYKGKFASDTKINDSSLSSDTNEQKSSCNNEFDEDLWAKLRQEFSKVEPVANEKKITFIPSGMGC